MHPIVGLFNKVKGTTFATVDTITDVKLTGGKQNPLSQSHVTKLVTGSSVMLSFSSKSNAYENMVRRQMAKEGISQSDFQLGSRTFGTPIIGTPFLEHNSETYIGLIFLKPGKVTYYVDGVLTPASTIIGLPVAKPTDESQGGIRSKVTYRTYKISSIKEIRALKQTFINGIHY